MLVIWISVSPVSYDPRGRAPGLKAWTCCTVFSCSGPQSKLAFLMSLGKWPAVTHPTEGYVASKIQRCQLDMEPLFLVIERDRCENLSFTLEEVSWNALHRRTLGHFTEVEVYWVFVALIFQFLTCKYLNIKSRVVATSCSLHLISTISPIW